MRYLYVMSKNFENKPRLIGILSEDNGKYRFEYKLDGKIQEWFLLIDEFPDVNKRYEGNDVCKFVSRMIPQRDSIYIDELLKSANLNEYDEWEMLKVFGQRNMKQDAYIYEHLPMGAILYENLESFI